ncbi:MAG: hypothetical protein ACE5DT_02075 [Nitrosopumilus sp.]
MEKSDSKKSIEELFKEEQEKVLAEINKKAEQRKRRMNPDENYEVDHDFLK